MRQIYPVGGPDWEVTTSASAGPAPAAVTALARLYRDGAEPAEPGRPWLRANMVTSTDGAAAVGNRSGGLSGPADRMVFTVLRSLADVILVGAGTARAEGYRPVSATEIWPAVRPAGAALPPLAVVSASLDLAASAGLLAGAPGSQPTIIITTAAGQAARRASLPASAQVIVAGQQRVDIGRAITALVSLGHRQILAEGGPSLLGQLTAAGLLDELCVTISPLLADGPAGRIVAPPPAPAGDHRPSRLRLAHVLADDDFLLCRYLRAD